VPPRIDVDTGHIISVIVKHQNPVDIAKGIVHSCGQLPAKLLNEQLVNRLTEGHNDFGMNFIKLLKEPLPAVKEKGSEELLYGHIMAFRNNFWRLVIWETAFNQIGSVYVIDFDSGRL